MTTPTVPSKVVPREPTTEMLSLSSRPVVIANIWRAMYDAAPAPAAVATEESERARFEAWMNALGWEDTMARWHARQGWDASVRDQLAAIASLRAENVRLTAERDARGKLLLRWLQAHNKMDGKHGLSMSEFDKMRQDTHAAIAKSGDHQKEGS